MGRKPKLKLFDSSGGAGVREELQKSATRIAPQEIIIGNNSLLGAGRQYNGLLTAEEAQRIPKRNQSGSVTRVPAAVLQTVSQRSLKEGTKVALAQNSRTRRRIASIAARAHASTDMPALEDTFPAFDDFCEVPISDMFRLTESNEDDQNAPDNTDLRYHHIIETMQGPAVVRRRHRYNQTRKQKKMTRQRKWDEQEVILADSLLQWFQTTRRNTSATEDLTGDVDAPPSLPSPGSAYFTIPSVNGLTWFRQDWPISTIHTAYPSQSLIAAGLLSNAPDTPGWAVSIRTLETYRLLRLARASYSIQAFVRTMSMAQQRTSTTSIQEKFSDAFDLYPRGLQDYEKRW